MITKAHKVIEWIHTAGLDNNMWNIELENKGTWLYGLPGYESDELPAHIALYSDSGAPDEILDMCDAMYWSETFGSVYFYWL